MLPPSSGLKRVALAMSLVRHVTEVFIMWSKKKWIHINIHHDEYIIINSWVLGGTCQEIA
jgi:hypothetical protein